MATLSIKNISEAIYLSSKNKSKDELDTLSKNVVTFLDRKQMLKKTDKILSDLQKAIDIEEGVVRANLYISKKLPDKSLDEIKNIIKDRMKAKNVELKTIIDPKLLGGIKIEIGDEILDATLFRKIHKLETYLIEN